MSNSHKPAAQTSDDICPPTESDHGEEGENKPVIQDLEVAQSLDHDAGSLDHPLPPPMYQAPVGLPLSFPALARVTVIPHLLPQPLSVGLGVEMTTASRTQKDYWKAQSSGLSVRVMGKEISHVISHHDNTERHEQVKVN